MTIQEQLLSMRDDTYRAFHCRLMPTIAPERVIGVRVPLLRQFAKQLRNTPQAAAFMAQLPHHYYEENNLHAFLLEQLRDFDECIAALDKFLPYVDNWATCDSMSPNVFKKCHEQLLPHLHRWIASKETYTIRFAIEMFMNLFLDDHFDPSYLDTVAAVASEEYYVRMMVAWYFATALAKQYDATLPILEQRRLAPWIHRKTIQKACESHRLTPEQKAYLALKR